MKELYYKYRSLSLGTKILIYMAVGCIAGLLWPEAAMAVEPVGDVFIRLLLMAAIPLVFFNLLDGLTNLDSLGVLGRLGGKIMAFYLATTTLALGLGITIMSIIRPGIGMELAEDENGEVGQEVGDVPGVTDILTDIFPDNAVAAFAEAEVAQVVVFAIFLGVATMLLPKEHKEPLSKLYDAFASALRKLVDIIMRVLGPIGIGALMAATVGEYGDQIFGPLFYFLLGIWIAQLCMFSIHMGIIQGFTGFGVKEFLSKTSEVYTTAAGTCSSLATLSVTLQTAKERLHLPDAIYSFTLPLGAQLNKDGTSIMLTAILLFTAQAVGIQFSAGEIVVILLLGLILSEGSGGIPGGGLVIALIFVEAFNLPTQMAVIMGGIYRLIDIGNTTINVTGDLVGTTLIAQTEGWDKDEAFAPASDAPDLTDGMEEKDVGEEHIAETEEI